MLSPGYLDISVRMRASGVTRHIEGGPYGDILFVMTEDGSVTVHEFQGPQLPNNQPWSA